MDSLVSIRFLEKKQSAAIPRIDVEYTLATGSGSNPYAGLDRFGRIIDLQWKQSSRMLVHLKYGYDLASNRTYRRDELGHSAGYDDLYVNDSLNRLYVYGRGELNSGNTGLVGSATLSQYWTLDPTGNWKGFTQTGSVEFNTTREHDAANKIESITTLSGNVDWETPPGYDYAGNMTAMPSPLDLEGTLEATYDAWNRLVKTDDGATVVEYAYDGLNRQISKTVSSTVRHFYYSDQWQVLEERLGSNATADRQYVWGQRYIDDMVLRDTTSERLYALQDALFNVVALTDDDGDVVERFAYQAYGQSEPLDPDYTTYSGTNYSWNYRFTGRELDLETGLQINRMRCLHHQLGRWLTRDPFGYDSGFNLYGYAQGRATGSLDPLGLRETDREWILPWEGGWTWGGTWDLWTNTSPSGHLNGLYTGHTVPPAFINAAAMQGAAQGFNCSADCLACMNKKLAAGTLIIVGGGAVAYGGTPRPIANAIAGREGPMRGRYLKSGVRAAGVRLAHNLPCAGATGAKVGEGIIQHATRVESAFKSGQLARGGVAILAVAEIAIEAYCTKNCLANPNFKCPNGLLTF